MYVVAMCMSLFFLVGGVNYVVDQYGRGVLRDAVDEGARAGARLGAPAGTCEARAQQTTQNLMAGKLGRGVTVVCSPQGNNMVATGTASFPGWIPGVPTWNLTVTGEARMEGP